MAKTMLLFTFFLFFCQFLSGQPAPYSAKGKVIEALTQKPLESVIILLKELPDSTIVLNTTSDTDGNFIFKEPPSGHYFLETKMPGFKTNKTNPFEVDGRRDHNAGVISMFVTDQLLSEIEVKAIQPPFLNSIDRKIYYPDNDIQARSGTISDILQNIPSITTDPEGNISLRGSVDVHFLLNGKPSALLNNNPDVVLEQIPANNIERIEIITNPSAKYRPDGETGLINIVTKKNSLAGFHGTVLANGSTHDRYNGNISMNYNPGKMNIAGMYGYWQNFNQGTLDDFRIIEDEFSGEESMFNLHSIRVGRPNSHTASFNLDYTPDENNIIGITADYFGLNAERNFRDTTIEYNDTGTIADFSTLRNEDYTESETTLGTSYEHTFNNEDQSLSIEGEYSQSNEFNNARYTDKYQFPLYPDNTERTHFDMKEHTTTLSAAYAMPLNEDLQLEAGYDGDYSVGDLDYNSDYYDINEMSWINNKGKTNEYQYTQNISAVYATLSQDFDKWKILGGLRAEQTKIDSKLVENDSLIPNHYFNLFPTLHLFYTLTEKHEFGISYSHRIDRPDPDELNPFPEYITPREIEAGNPLLKPEQIHSIELEYRYHTEHLSFFPSIYYKQTYDEFSDVTRYINDSTTLTVPLNIEKERWGGLECALSWTPSKNYHFNLNSNIFYQLIDAENIGYEERTSISSDTKLAAYFNVFKSTKIQFNATYRSSTLTAQGKLLPVYFVNAGFRQELFHNKCSLTLTIS
ncbi:MAG: TonB-dependent receptor, partial [Saprospiraceae bacterium]